MHFSTGIFPLGEKWSITLSNCMINRELTITTEKWWHLFLYVLINGFYWIWKMFSSMNNTIFMKGFILIIYYKIYDWFIKITILARNWLGIIYFRENILTIYTWQSNFPLSLSLRCTSKSYLTQVYSLNWSIFCTTFYILNIC